MNLSPLTKEEIAQLFEHSEPPSENTFEVALVLGGTVSAGAYTAGAVDFLIEALDCWTRLRDKPGGDLTAPKHKIILRVITGTSGGGVNAAIAARALAYDYPHVVRATPNSPLLKSCFDQAGSAATATTRMASPSRGAATRMIATASAV
jgi:hypothetical protein